MSPGFSTDFKEQVRSRTDLVELIGETISLRPQRGGAEYAGLCPFHDDHNPSLRVYPDRQSFRCWVCDEGGDCFSWVMRLENVEFREAMELLARRANLEIPRGARRRSDAENKQKPQIYDVLRWAETEFHHCLLKSPGAQRARNYLAERGFTAETIGKFRIGYHPNDWEWLLGRAGGRFPVEQLLEARLVGKKQETGRTFDYFIDRVMFPIRDDGGRVVAFGGRVLPDRAATDAAKYWNSPEGPLFTKSKLLYGFDVSREAIRRGGTAVVMEGYTDCMMAHQHGLAHCVGTLGTSLTETHVLALKRFARNVVLVFDGDAAGQSAAERALLKFLPLEVDLRILTLPDGLDPADYLQAHGADAFRNQVDAAVEAWDYKLQATITKHGVGSIDARQRVLDEIVDLLAQVPRLSGNIRQDMLLGDLSRRLRLDEQTVRSRLSEARRRHSRRQSRFQPVRVDDAETPSAQNTPDNAKPNKVDLLERELLEIVLAVPQTIDRIRSRVACDCLRHPELRLLLETCYRLADSGRLPSYENLTLELEDAELKRLAALIEQSAREKQMAARLAERPEQSPGGRSLLETAIDRFVWRTEQAAHEKSKGEFIERHGASSGLDPKDKELLRLIAEFHRKRATKKSLT